MPGHVPVPVLVAAVSFVSAVLPAGDASAQAPVRAAIPVPVSTHASVHPGKVTGMVRDDIGRAISGASVVALGAVLSAAKSDDRGYFNMSLPPGEYILRAVRDGYVSTYREAVRVQTSVELQRDITLIRQGMIQPLAEAQPGSAAASTAKGADPRGADHSHSETAWRLRHLPRSVLRDDNGATAALEETGQNSFAPRTSIFDRFFAGTDFVGQVNFLTTSAFAPASGWLPAQWPRGVAYIAVGAAAGSHGDWRMRGAINAGDASSWVLLGEYERSHQATHAYRFGVSYSAQGYEPQSIRSSTATLEAKNVAGVSGFDRWRLHPALAIDYGLRFDRYDYIATPELLSPEVGARVRLLPGTFVRARAARWMVAPGADEFLPPMAQTPWMPPERTFSSLVRGAGIDAEEVRHIEFGLEHEFAGASRTLSFRRFHQSSINQVATIFGTARDVGHYFVATPGTADVEGWAVRLAAQLGARLAGSVEYTLAEAAWGDHRSRQMWAVRRVAPSAVRTGSERLHDFATSFEAHLPETSTQLTMIVHVNTGFSAGNGERAPIADGRYEISVRQALPYQPLRGGKLELLFAVRTLMRDPRERGSFYDELLTIAPPMRLMGGVQMKF
jgi:hypothetical protein